MELETAAVHNKGAQNYDRNHPGAGKAGRGVSSCLRGGAHAAVLSGCKRIQTLKLIDNHHPIKKTQPAQDQQVDSQGAIAGRDRLRTREPQFSRDSRSGKANSSRKD